MQTLRLPAVVLRDLRAISSGFHPSRRPTPSPPAAAIWKGTRPLPNHPRPTLAVGLLSTARRGGMRGAPCLSNSPVWAPPVRQRNAPPERFQDAVSPSAVGPSPAASYPQPGRCPPLGAGLLLAAPLRELHSAGPRGADAVPQVCRWQTTSARHRKPAPFAAQVPDPPHGQARRSATLRAASNTLSFARRPQRCRRAPRCGARSGGQTTVRLVAVGSTRVRRYVCMQYAPIPAVAG
jgi:hypothetical protein